MIQIQDHLIDKGSIEYISPIHETEKSNINFSFIVGLKTGREIVIEYPSGWRCHGKMTEHTNPEGKLIRNEKSSIQEVYKSEGYQTARISALSQRYKLSHEVGQVIEIKS